MAFIQGEQVEATATPEEKDARLEHLRDFQGRHAKANAKALKQLQKVAMAGGNVFEELLKTVQSCSLGQITHALYEVGGRYRRSMEFPEPWLTEASASLERMRWDGATEVRYRRKTSHACSAGPTFAPEEHLDPADFMTRVLIHVPEPLRHLVGYYGAYSNASRRRGGRASSISCLPFARVCRCHT